MCINYVPTPSQHGATIRSLTKRYRHGRVGRGAPLRSSGEPGQEATVSSVTFALAPHPERVEHSVVHTTHLDVVCLARSKDERQRTRPHDTAVWEAVSSILWLAMTRQDRRKLGRAMAFHDTYCSIS